MRYDLNFWTPIDWRRESSIDPRFLAAAGLCVILLMIATAWRISYSGVQTAKQELQMAKEKNEHIKDAAAEVQRQSDCIRYWQEIRGKMSRKEVVRMPWSNMLAQLQAEVPETVVLQGIVLRAAPTPVELPEAPVIKTSSSGGRKPTAIRLPTFVTKLRYELTISGIAIGTNADDVISRFSRLHKNSKAEFASYLDSAELIAVEPETKLFGKMPGKKFTISCKLKPLDWYEESAAKTQ